MFQITLSVCVMNYPLINTKAALFGSTMYLFLRPFCRVEYFSQTQLYSKHYSNSLHTCTYLEFSQSCDKASSVLSTSSSAIFACTSTVRPQYAFPRQKELLHRGYRVAFTSAALREQQDRVAELEERAAALEDALRRYCGLPTEKSEARRQLDDLTRELVRQSRILLSFESLKISQPCRERGLVFRE